MRYGIFADVHGNLEALESVLAVFQEEDIDSYLCVGDLVGYGANPRECIDRIGGLACPVVAGNHDWAAVELFPLTYFNSAAHNAITWTQGILWGPERAFLSSLGLVFKNEELTLAHGTLHNPGQFHYMVDSDAARRTFGVLQTSVCFVGHSHVPGVFVQDADGAVSYDPTDSIAIKGGMRYIINCGSVGQPRDCNPDAACCVYDTAQRKAVIRRASYDRATARKKIIDAGLPPALGDRLMFGR